VANLTSRSALSKLFERSEPEERLQRVWRKLEARRRRRGSPAAIPTMLAAAFVGLVVSFALVWIVARDGSSADLSSRTRSAPSAVQSEPALEASESETLVEPGPVARELDFGDGAHVTVGAGGKLEILERGARSVTLALRQGLAQFDIRPGGARRWQIESGGVTVEVVGTQFSLERTASSLRVEVQRGRVLVRGARISGQVQALNAGSVLTVPASDLSDAPAASSPAPAPPVSARPSAARASWRAAASERDWGRAWGDLGAAGLAQQSRRSDDVEELFALADVARLSGHPESAVGPLQKIVEQHASDARAGVAAFALGRVWLDALGQPHPAAAAFESALALKLPATLAEDARARLVEALVRSGEPARAHEAATDYRHHHPSGARRADVDRWSPAP